MNRLRTSLVLLALTLTAAWPAASKAASVPASTPVSAPAPAPTPSAAAAGGPFQATQRDRGTSVELAIRNAADAAAPLREGQAAQFTLTLQDETTGSAVNGAFPNMWLVPYRLAGNDEPKRCTAAIAALLTGGLNSPAALDLNVYYVLTLNGDGTINVVDPHFSFGGSQLLGMVELDHPGYDWALASGGDRLFVTVPASNHVAVVDTIHWKLERYLDAGPDPRRVIASADGRQVWVSTDRGVTVLRAADLTVLATIPTGPGEHDLAVSDDGAFLIATSRAGGTATLIDARANAAVAEIAVGEEPLSVVFSPLAGTAYVAGAKGRVTVIDPKRRKAIAQFEALPGLTQIRMAPGGRFGFIANPVKDVVQIVDTASNRVVQTADISDGPFDISFTSTLAYVRRLRSEAVDMIPLAGIGKEGDAVPVVDFPAGEYPFGKAPRTTAAAGIVSAPDENAVLVANPADKHIYYYKEGMAAPIGHFSNYGHFAQAVLVLDRSIKATRGAYAATALLPPAGEYDVAVFVNSPRTTTCFRVAVAPDPAAAAKRSGMPVTIEQLTADRVVPVGGPARLSFLLRDTDTQQPRAALADAMVLIVKAGSTWFTRQALAGEGGRYQTDFVPPSAGVYYVYVGAPSIGLKTSNPHFLTLEAR
jgi:DNA-binding beta-propeller fold protein YncE